MQSVTAAAATPVLDLNEDILGFARISARQPNLDRRPGAGGKRIIKRRISDVVYIVAQRFVADSQDYFEQLRLGIARRKKSVLYRLQTTSHVDQLRL